MAKPEDPPALDVTREQFALHAKIASWEQKSIDLFLGDCASVNKHVMCNKLLLRVIDWPPRPACVPRTMDRSRPRDTSRLK